MGKISIIGNPNPEIGTLQQYSVFKAFEFSSIQSPVFGTSQHTVHWEIYVLERGNWRKTDGNAKTGEQVSYTFNQKSLIRKGIKLVATKGNEKAELSIRTKPAKKPKINKIDLLDINGHKVTVPLNYADTLIAKAHCTDMEGESLHFTLWEDDAKREGHNIINQVNKINPIPQRATVKKGIAQVRFNMAQYTMASHISNMQVAKGDKNEGKTHEYYVTAEYYGKLEASNNVNLKNPDYNTHQNTEQKKAKVADQVKNTPAKSATTVKQPNKKPELPKPSPKKETYKIPVTQGAKTKAADPQGKVISVEFVDFLGKPYKSMKFGTQAKAKIVTQNMKGKTIKLRIWEDDISNQLVFEKNYVLRDDISEAIISLTEDMRKKGDDWKEGSEQEYFLEIEYAGQSIDSEVVNVNNSSPKIKMETGKSMVMVRAEKREQETNGKCPNCEKDITLSEIKAICVDKKNKKGIEKCLIEDDKMIKAALPFLNKYRKKVGINTCIRKAHFLAQISQESKFYDLQERFKYSSASRMNGIFDSYFKQFGKNRMKEAERLSELSLNKQNWEQVANAIYGKTHPNGKKHTDPNDGWRYSGKGFKQITWKGNYEELEKYANKTFGTNYIWTNGNNPYKLKNNPEDAITSALAFWGKNNINAVATEISDTSVLNVTHIINKNNEGLDERKRYFKKAVEVLQVEKCKPKGKTKVQTDVLSTYDGKYKASKKVIYIDAILPTDRKYQGLLVFFNETEILHKCYTLGYGTGGDKLKPEGKGPIPNGLWSSWYTKTHIGEASYGAHGLIHISGIDGDALTATQNGREGIAIHAGHTVGEHGKQYSDKGYLMVTYGCLRVYNEDIEKLVDLYLNNSDKKIKVYVEEVEDIFEVYKYYDMKRDPKEPTIKGRNKQKHQ
ncbi:hypothetical protein GCM10022217_09430 [Chryseobacterium ginsenosidimutans]|uniref:glycoside hydrolase family 19 protein n=1 Tax=Chryseobacterium ginsenosidimutans TaxID=687846 RepID=UPI0031CFC37B